MTQDSTRQQPPSHIRLFIPGPTEVRPSILEAQARWMIGHRMPECADLIGDIKPKLAQVFMTEQHLLITASSGTGLWEAAIRNTVGQKVLNCVNGAFSDRWRHVTEANGKANEVLTVDWGQPILPQAVVERLAAGGFDAVTIVHNETSTGVISPVREIAEAIRAMPQGDNIMILVDAVSSLAGARLDFDNWDLDVALASSQKAFALPPGLAFCAVSRRAMGKAESVPHRGYYFDFLTLEKYMLRNQTPATPAVSLLFALNQQLDDILAEGLAERFARHLQLRELTIAWLRERDLALFAAPGYESPTVTCVDNTRGLDIPALNQHLRRQGMIISDGYGPLKGKNFRIAHMGDVTEADMQKLLAAMDSFLAAS